MRCDARADRDIDTYRGAQGGAGARMKGGRGGVGDSYFSQLRCYYVQSTTHGSGSAISHNRRGGK